jgi:Glycine zipper 2TM domain
VVVRIPAGTQLAVQITEPLSTKTTTVGTPVAARLAEDLVIDGQRVARAGASVHGTVASVVSAKKKIGGKAKMGLTFDSLELVGGEVVTIAASTLEEGKSSTAKDAAKIGGGTAAGAILGHQVDGDKGKLIGGILGGALGTLAATQTGAELELPADTVIAVVLDQEAEIRLPR